MKLGGYLVLEVTRKCNMGCEHCLRGHCQNLDMTIETAKNTLDKFEYISNLTFTGGEPTLNAKLIKWVAKYIKERDIGFGSFYVVSNGKEYSRDLVDACLDLWCLSEEKDFCGLSVSIDQFHSGFDKEAYLRYSALSFFNHDKECRDGMDRIIDRGNAQENGIGTFEKEVSEFDPRYADAIGNGESIDLGDNVFYVNVNGDVVFDCDLSYEQQEEYKVGNINTDDVPGILSEIMAQNEELD